MLRRINWPAIVAGVAAVVAVVLAWQGEDLAVVTAVVGLAITSAILS